MFKKIQIVFAVMFIMLIIAYIYKGTDHSGEKYKAFNSEKDFTLKDQDGKTFHLKDHRGKIVLLFFGYLSCPDICPVTLSKLSRVYQKLGNQKDSVLTVFVSVDPQRDTPEKMKEYLKYFNVQAVGLTGTKEEIDRVVNAYKATYEMVPMDSAMKYAVNHTDYLYCIGQKGNVVETFHQDDTAEKIYHFLKELIS